MDLLGCLRRPSHADDERVSGGRASVRPPRPEGSSCLGRPSGRASAARSRHGRISSLDPTVAEAVQTLPPAVRQETLHRLLRGSRARVVYQRIDNDEDCGDGDSSGGVDSQLLQRAMQASLDPAQQVQQVERPSGPPYTFYEFFHHGALDYHHRLDPEFYACFGEFPEVGEPGQLAALEDLRLCKPVPGREVVQVNLKADLALQEFKRDVLHSLGPLPQDSGNVVQVAKDVACVVARRLGGVCADHELAAQHDEESFRLQQEMGSAVLALGMLQSGLARHRALMVKLALEWLGFSSRVATCRRSVSYALRLFVQTKAGDEVEINLTTAPGTTTSGHALAGGPPAAVPPLTQRQRSSKLGVASSGALLHREQACPVSGASKSMPLLTVESLAVDLGVTEELWPELCSGGSWASSRVASREASKTSSLGRSSLSLQALSTSRPGHTSRSGSPAHGPQPLHVQSVPQEQHSASMAGARSSYLPLARCSEVLPAHHPDSRPWYQKLGRRDGQWSDRRRSNTERPHDCPGGHMETPFLGGVPAVGGAASAPCSMWFCNGGANPFAGRAASLPPQLPPQTALGRSSGSNEWPFSNPQLLSHSIQTQGSGGMRRSKTSDVTRRKEEFGGSMGKAGSAPSICTPAASEGHGGIVRQVWNWSTRQAKEAPARSAPLPSATEAVPVPNHSNVTRWRRFASLGSNIPQVTADDASDEASPERMNRPSSVPSYLPCEKPSMTDRPSPSRQLPPRPRSPIPNLPRGVPRAGSLEGLSSDGMVSARKTPRSGHRKACGSERQVAPELPCSDRAMDAASVAAKEAASERNELGSPGAEVEC